MNIDRLQRATYSFLVSAAFTSRLLLLSLQSKMNHEVRIKALSEYDAPRIVLMIMSRSFFQLHYFRCHTCLLVLMFLVGVFIHASSSVVFPNTVADFNIPFLFLNNIGEWV